jgi:hypothetical protein
MLISSKRLDIDTVLPDEHLLLQEDLANPDLWKERGFTDPVRYFVTNPNTQVLTK